MNSEDSGCLMHYAAAIQGGTLVIGSSTREGISLNESMVLQISRLMNGRNKETGLLGEFHIHSMGKSGQEGDLLMCITGPKFPSNLAYVFLEDFQRWLDFNLSDEAQQEILSIGIEKIIEMFLSQQIRKINTATHRAQALMKAAEFMAMIKNLERVVSQNQLQSNLQRQIQSLPEERIPNEDNRRRTNKQQLRERLLREDEEQRVLLNRQQQHQQQQQTGVRQRKQKKSWKRKGFVVMIIVTLFLGLAYYAAAQLCGFHLNQCGS